MPDLACRRCCLTSNYLALPWILNPNHRFRTSKYSTVSLTRVRAFAYNVVPYSSHYSQEADRRHLFTCTPNVRDRVSSKSLGRRLVCQKTADQRTNAYHTCTLRVSILCLAELRVNGFLAGRGCLASCSKPQSVPRTDADGQDHMPRTRGRRFSIEATHTIDECYFTGYLPCSQRKSRKRYKITLRLSSHD